MLMKLLIMGQWCKKHKIRKIPGFINVMIRILYACDIPSNMSIPMSTYFAHNGLGVVINASTQLGENIVIYPHVIIGKHKDMAPMIGDNVIIGAGAMILGNVHIGKGAKIGAGSIVMKDVEANTFVTCKLAEEKRDNQHDR